MSVIKIKVFILSFLIFFSLAKAEISNPLKLNQLFKELKQIDDLTKADLIEREIWKIWSEHPNTQNLTDKLELGTELMNMGDFNYALKVFTNIVNTDPSWPEAWNKRATLLYFMQEYQKSLDDIDKVLSIEPRHFGALSGRAQIFIKLEKYQKAINNLKEAKIIYPMIKSANIISKLEKLIKGFDV